jgi:dienelactone hydrolase
LALPGLVFATASAAFAEEPVKFRAVDVGSAAHRADDSNADQTGAPVASIQGYLTKPIGVGPFPAVVLLHSCLGLPAARRAIANMFAGWGYVALFVDDFTTRGLKETCAVDFEEGASDAFGALTFLSKLPYVEPQRIAVVGYSQGADAALRIAATRPVASRDSNFKVAVAFYPPCGNLAEARFAMPTLILIGESDDVTPAADCERLARNQPDIKLVVYPGAYHLFDAPEFIVGRRLSGMWLKYDADAARRSMSEMRDFLRAKLSR